MARVLIYFGIVLLVIGLLWPLVEKLGLGRLPGDIVVKRENFSFHFPITTMVVISAAGSIIISIILKLFK